MKNRYLKDVTTLKLNQESCTGCGSCIDVCPHNVFDIVNGKTQIIDKDGCMECGACAKNCPFNAIEVTPGVGCAYAIIIGWLAGTKPSCTSSDNSGCC
ncbi:MAG TPA: mercury methylation ferredoxin HgcB [Clostridia bacterium]